MGAPPGARVEHTKETVIGTAVGLTAFIVTLLVMVTFHEFGHYITARKFGIKVEEFFVGFGPRLYSRRRGETEFGLKAILLGGYVKIAGMNPFQEVAAEDRPRTFGAKPAWQRAIVLVAGSFTHFILATVVFAVLYGAVGIRDIDRPLTVVDQVVNKVGAFEGPAHSAGLRAGDKVVAIDGRNVETWEQVRDRIRPAAGRPLEFGVERDGQVVTLTITPVEAEVPSADDPEVMEKVGQIGVAPSFAVVRDNPIAAVGKGFATTVEAIGASVVGAGQIFSPDGIGNVFTALQGAGEREITAEEPIGLVGGARLAGQASAAGATESLISFLGAFIVFVGVINLAPLPPLDGGHLLVLGIEKLIRRNIDARKVIPVAAVVLSFFLFIAVALLYLDIARPLVDPFQ
ncbi:MAG: M50 family metallopeptidase [Actinomycetota bacterium]